MAAGVRIDPGIMQREITVDLGPRSYRIRIAPGLLAQAGDLGRDWVAGRRCLVVSDAHVAPLYAGALAGALAAAGADVRQATVPAGEAAKCPARLFELFEAALDAGLDRHAPWIALGGGVVGDLAGFAAAAYLRGCPWIQVPTTLLAMVDSSVGGKTGINLPRGKNLVGAFHQPRIVLADPDVLRTLPEREYAAGLAEVVKYGVIRDPTLFAFLEQNIGPVRAREAGALTAVIARCCEIKAEIVGRDELEAGERAVLNFGHTLGHALEQAGNYAQYLHGEAVAIGMMFAAHLARRQLGFPAADGVRLAALLQALGLPTRPRAEAWPDLAAAMQHDKKAAGGVVRWVLADRLGQARHGIAVPEDVLRRTYEEDLFRAPAAPGPGKE